MAIAGDGTAVTGSDNTAGTALVTAARNLAAGRLNVVGCRYDGALTTATFTDSAGNTYPPGNEIVLASGGAAQMRIHLNFVENCAANASNVVTCTLGAARSYRRVFQRTYIDAPVSGALQDSDTGQGGSGFPQTMQSAAVSASGDAVVIGWLGAFYNALNSSVINNSFSLAAFNVNQDYCALIERFVSAGNYTPSVEASEDPNEWAVIAVVFGSAVSGGSGGGRRLSLMGVGR